MNKYQVQKLGVSEIKKKLFRSIKLAKKTQTILAEQSMPRIISICIMVNENINFLKIYGTIEETGKRIIDDLCYAAKKSKKRK